MTESAPVDPTSTEGWKKLDSIAADFTPDLRGWFDSDPGRAEQYTFQAADLTVDLSKGLVTEDVLAALLQVAKDTGVAERFQAMLSGEHINVTEDRAVLHTALRRPKATRRARPGGAADGRRPGRRRRRARHARQGLRVRVAGA
ncbi:hypothetical protein QP157_08035 [Sphingomonas sp. LR61]|uniref:hypothetical protein n=1 Tax=Sphingomonas sp. LR61 TaxID=3050234 RepID=UPI002FE0D107